METSMQKNMVRAKFIKKAREERAWTQSQLATVADVNIRTIQRLERDGTASFETLMGVAQAFEIDVQQLMPTSSRGQKISKPEKKVHLLSRLTSGKDFAKIVGGSDRFQVEHDEADDIRAINAMKDILAYLKRDLVRWHDASPIEKLNIEFDLSQEINNLENHGFYLFGIKRQIPQIDNQKIQIAMCTIYMSHARSPKIVRDSRSNMVIPALLPEVAQGLV